MDSTSISTLHFVHSFVPISGGTTTRMCALLQDETYRHHLVTLRGLKGQQVAAEALSFEESFGHIEVRRVDEPVESGSRVPGLKGARQRRAFIDALVEASSGLDIDIVHGHNPAFLGAAGLEVARRLKRPYIYEIHKLVYDSVRIPKGPAGWRTWAKREMERRREAVVAQAADLLIVQADEIKARTVELFGVAPERIHVLPMGVEPGLFDPRAQASARQRLRAEFGCGDRVCFLYNGSLGSETGIDFFLRTVQGLPERVKAGMKVVVLGRGALQPLVERISAEEPDLVLFAGLRDYTEMPAVYSACDVHVLPYPRMDCWDTNVPTKLLEGMAMERLILASNVKGIASVLGDAGAVYPAEDGGALARTIEHIVEHYEQFDAHRARARRAVVEQYDWQHMRDQLHAIYEQLAAKRPVVSV